MYAHILALKNIFTCFITHHMPQQDIQNYNPSHVNEKFANTAMDGRAMPFEQ